LINNFVDQITGLLAFMFVVFVMVVPAAVVLMMFFLFFIMLTGLFLFHIHPAISFHIVDIMVVSRQTEKIKDLPSL